VVRKIITFNHRVEKPIVIEMKISAGAITNQNAAHPLWQGVREERRVK
jgi:hypothetical protein